MLNYSLKGYSLAGILVNWRLG